MKNIFAVSLTSLLLFTTTGFAAPASLKISDLAVDEEQSAALSPAAPELIIRPFRGFRPYRPYNGYRGFRPYRPYNGFRGFRPYRGYSPWGYERSPERGTPSEGSMPSPQLPSN